MDTMLNVCTHCGTSGQLYIDDSPGYKDIVCLRCGHRRTIGDNLPIPKPCQAAALPYPEEVKVTARFLRQAGMQYNDIQEIIKQQYGKTPCKHRIHIWTKGI
jgi:DNA-directed RNA polymerase subunit RPC12/RpoP